MNKYIQVIYDNISDSPESFFKENRFILGTDEQKYDALKFAIDHNCCNVVNYIIESGINPMCSSGTTKKNNELSVLHLLILNDYYELVEDIFNKNSLCKNVYNILLHYSVLNNKFKMIKLIIEKGADINILYDNKSIMDNAITNSDLYTVKYLVNKGAILEFDIPKNTIYKHSSLITAIKHLKLNIIKYLIEEKHISVNCWDYDYDKKTYINSALMCAVLTNNIEIVKYLIEHKADVNDYNNEDYCALSLAVKNNNSEIVEYLVNHCVNGNIIKSIPFKKNSIIIALENDNLQIIKILCNHFEFDYNKMVMFSKSKQTLEFFVNYYVNKGLDKKVVINAELDGMVNAFYPAIHENNVEVFNYLLENECNINYISPELGSVYEYTMSLQKNIDKIIIISLIIYSNY